MAAKLGDCRKLVRPSQKKKLSCDANQLEMEIWPACLCHGIIPLLITAGFIIPFTTGSCSDGKCPVSFYFTIGRNMVDGHTLLNHVFSTVSVTGVIDCYGACQTNCRCISFNFLTHFNQDNCQLNEENRYLKPGALIPMEGSQYYDLGIIYHAEACTQCFNRCCMAQPCFNGGTCQENCHETGRRFLCHCPARFIGNVCEKDCQDALGMESSDISDAQLSASTELVPEKGAKHSRLQSKWNGVSGGGWIAKISDTNQWLQIDLLDQHSYVVTKIATQGRNYYHNRTVTKYKLQYSDDGVTFLYYREEGQVTDKVFPGNTDRDTVVSHELIPPIRARYIRFRPIEWSGLIGMRVELYGCRDN